MHLENDPKIDSFKGNLNTKLILALAGYCLFMFILNFNQSLALQYTNYTSDKYQIKFQYPSTWQINEKTDRFDESADIRIKDVSSGDGSIYVSVNRDRGKAPGGLDIQTITEVGLDSSRDYLTEARIIESPTYFDIKGHPAGTFVFTAKDNEASQKYAAQNWYVLLRDRDYVVQFSSKTDLFDSPEYIEIRHAFVKSLSFFEKES